MTTLKERFAEKFYAEEVDKTVCCKAHATYATVPEILSFFQQELLALAEEVSQLKADGTMSDALIKYNVALRQAITLIRSKANELL